ncbi:MULTISPECIES: pseudouridine synthase [unclassified Fusibacter]|uniref:pseudouridine synthase n=1 Tax=unclassified Fusibacter TaxID=2624464 RepID=UPI0010109BE4|nr:MULTISPECIES: pseudouridine synthase [unclassified Fusibacter]MCK8058043.1 pseudouridine synthase [Fusibacter sp. A2]NPE20625.1 pseudouridine synthase [Fusibacter sp. A1]RXV62832.1 pseudouridine synthase [Fusibacter sp. A1]
MRIGKLLSNAGICSRRDANRLIDEGRVYVNGERCIPGKWVEWTDEILLDGEPVKMLERIYILLNKPKGILCSSNRSLENNIIDYLNYDAFVFPVGRLDKESDGLILMTNDGELANSVLRDEYEHEKEYLVSVDKEFDDDFLTILSGGVEIFGTMTRPCTVIRVSHDTFRIILSQGINRQIRKMCKKFGYEVTRLKRIRIVNMKLGDLPTGEWRFVTAEELEKLKTIIGIQS